ncbi:MAG: hypothetical protein JWO66_1466 [Candidatus Eremiobacteraeota bacterium]|jgi:hypothetical protein|nr:hypothetical protein [Candidatus Eremiobacteraeota bacterium]
MRENGSGVMKIVTGVLAVAAAVAFAAIPAARADAAFSDQLCPEATQYVVALTSMGQNDPPQKVYDAAHAASSAYASCARRQLSDNKIEPGVHYAYTRQAGFSVVEARALLALNRPAEAKAVLENSKRLAADVFDWRRPLSTVDPGSKDTRPSIYHNAAQEILDSTNAMLAKLTAVPAAAPPAAAAPSPLPSGA